MKKTEFMRCAAKEFMDFFAELYLDGEYTSQQISLKGRQSSFTIRYCGGILKFYTYITGTISYNCGSFVGTRTDFKEYYTFDISDDHEEVLKKLREDLRVFKKYFSEVFHYASFENDPTRLVTFKYSEPFSTSLRIYEEQSEEEE